MKALMNSRGLIWGIAVFLMVIFLYSLTGRSTLPADPNQAPIGADLLKISNDLSKVTLNPEIFSNPAYRMLTDFSLPLGGQPVGRPNPFDIIGRD